MSAVCGSSLVKGVSNSETREEQQTSSIGGKVAAKQGPIAKTHCKNDSGSYEDILSGKATSCSSHSSGSSSGCDSSGVGSPAQNRQQPLTITVTNGNGVEGVAHSSAPPPPRTVSAASMTSSLCQDQSSSSSSLSRDVSHINSSFTSHEALEQLLTEMSTETAEQEVVKQLVEHIVNLKLDLENLRLENDKLKEMRTTMDDELHTLTENLFEEAYKMVDTVKEEKGAVSKRLADATGKIDAMETEMSALKSLLNPKDVGKGSASSPAGARKEVGKKSPSLHKHHKPNVKKAIRKLSRKVKASTLGRTPTSHAPSCQPVTQLEHKSEIRGASLQEGKVPPGELSEFKDWLSASVSADHPYLLTLEAIDVQPCLTFRNKELSERLLPAAKTNDLVMESLPPCADSESRVCVLTKCGGVCCTHRMQLGFSDEWYFISEQCRNRIVAACDFYTYVGHIARGFIKLEPEQLYWQVSRLRAMMNLARLNLELPDQ